MARLTVYLILGVCMVGVSGCQSMPWQQSTLPPVELLDDTPGATTSTQAASQPSGLQLSTSQRIKDVPLPAKAKEDLDRSYVYESSNLQLGRMVYTIRAPVNDIAQFYIDTTPAAGWHLVNVKQAEGGAELLFQKDGKKLEVSILPLGTFRGQRLVLHLVPNQVTRTGF